MVTVGNFDGVHLGHQQLLQGLLTCARRRQLETAVVLFEPQPKEFFLGDKAPPRLSSLRDKVMRLRELGIDWVWVKRFDRALADETPEAFVEECLADGLGARHVVVGDDFRFGAKRSGDLSLLQELGPRYGFTAEGTDSFLAGEQRISSTAIRDALMNSDFARAEALLGRPYCMSGTVVYGQQLGRELGFPTANVRLSHHQRAVEGVYRVRVRVEGDGRRHRGIANVGVKPSFPELGPWLEVHLLDGKPSLYGCHIQVEFIERVRPAVKFASLDELRNQIASDIDNARTAFETEDPTNHHE